MDGEAALRRQARSEKGKRGKTEWAGRDAEAGRRPGDKRDRRKIEAKRDDAGRPARDKAGIGGIERRLQPSKPFAHPSDGMADRAIERPRIADERLDDQGGERERQRKRE